MEDEKSVREVYLQVLSIGLPDCRVDVAVNGAEGVDAFCEALHGILIIDLRMPVMDGETAFHKIEEICREQNIEMPAVIFCTGFTTSDTILNITKENPKHCILNKPFDTNSLVKNLLSRIK